MGIKPRQTLLIVLKYGHVLDYQKTRTVPLVSNYRKVLLSQYPDKSQMGWPTYIIFDTLRSEDTQIL